MTRTEHPRTANTEQGNTEQGNVAVPENPSPAELKASLEDADFPQASHMAKEIFGENPRLADEEE
ncbi:hypothetical protein ACFFUB_06600 [Algimonas porphyrae]|uniref:Uncharacterized protein n=1 Tax=Algimonas porphyrae TaxID=1128113 RepID=A0ABQ5V0U3_9PROT|nr:hypothetical protein [Algimonas porphyrae]GLQ21168.1 hypothetical protein GCM10007854_21230 [Algimonas porphyrae]